MALPRTFLLCDRVQSTILGAILVRTGKETSEDYDMVVWHCDLSVKLDTPFNLSPHELRLKAKLLHLSKIREAQVRQSCARVGGILNQRFLSCAGERWQVWPADDDILDVFSIFAGAPFTFKSVRAFARAASVTPEAFVAPTGRLLKLMLMLLLLFVAVGPCETTRQRTTTDNNDHNSNNTRQQQ